MYSRVSFHFCESARSQKEPQAKMLGAMKFDALPYLGSVLGGRGGRGDEVPPEPGLIKTHLLPTRGSGVGVSELSDTRQIIN
jgi:hypothetical protein